jgi:hypothetical protein
MSPRDTQPTISALLLERYRLGELPADERRTVADRLASDPDLRRRLEDLERSDRKIAATHPAGEMAAAIRRRALASGNRPAAARRRPGPWLVPASVVAVSACLVVAASLWVRRPGVEDTTIKGGEASLVLHRRTEGGSEPLSRGAVARQGDQIRVGYRASHRRYGAILSIDGRGAITQHLPRTGERAVALQPTGTVFLDFAYELDAAPRWEAFYFVTADAPFDLEPVKRAMHEASPAGARAPGTLVLPNGFTQFLFPLSKDPQ